MTEHQQARISPAVPVQVQKIIVRRFQTLRDIGLKIELAEQGGPDSLQMGLRSHSGGVNGDDVSD